MDLFGKLKAAAKFATDTGELVSALRDCARGNGCLRLARRLLTLYKEKGKMIRLSVDSENKQLEVEVHLKGQDKPLKVTARSYEVVAAGPACFITFREIETSWEWLNVLLRTFRATERRFELPEQYSELIQLAL